MPCCDLKQKFKLFRKITDWLNHAEESEEHKQIYREFHNVMVQRTQLTMAVLIIQYAFQFATGNTDWHRSRNHLEEAAEVNSTGDEIVGKYDLELGERIYPILMFTQLAMNMARVLLLVASLKWRKNLTQYFLYHQLLYMMLKMTFPDDYGSGMSLLVKNLNYNNFTFMHF